MAISTPSMQDLLSAGVHFGHKTSRGHPKMGQFIYGAREGVHIIDLAKSEEKLKEATDAAYNFGKSGSVMLILGTKKQAQSIVENLAKEAGVPYLNQRWMGGTFTNFDEVRKNIKKLIDLKIKLEKGELANYTKKEQLLISKKIHKFTTEMGGIANMEKLPDVLFVVDAVSDKTAVVEAKKVGVKVLGLCDTNADPYWFDFPVPANDDGIKSIKLICETLIGAYIKGKKESSTGMEDMQQKELVKDESKVVKAKKDLKVKEPEIVSAGLDEAVKEETAVLEEEIEKVVLEESERKVE